MKRKLLLLLILPAIRPEDEDRKEENLRAWQELTSPDIPLSDIERVVYGYSLEQMRGLSGAKDSRNLFAKLIASTGDSGIADFLDYSIKNYIN